MLIMQTSVHLQTFPKPNIGVSSDIVNNMDKVRDVCNCVFSLRKDANIRVRMPLKKITICGQSDLDNAYLEIIKQEVNAKEIDIFNDNIDNIATKEIVLNMKECGKLFGSQLKNILQAQKEGNWIIDNDKLKISGFELDKELYNIVYKSKTGEKIMPCRSFNLLVMIDTTQTIELIMEGLARDLVRMIQQERKDQRLEISDRIKIVINTNDEIINNTLSNWQNYICEQTLSNNINIEKQMEDGKNIEIDGHQLSIKVEKVF